MDFTTLSLADLLAVDFASLSSEDQAAYQGELRTRFEVIQEVRTSGGTPTVAQAREAHDLAARFGETRALVAAAADEEPASDEDVEALASLSLDPPEELAETEEELESDEEPEDEATEEASSEVVEEATEITQAAATRPAAVTRPRLEARSARVALAGRRPEHAPSIDDMLTITAAADTANPAGSTLTLEQVGQAAVTKLESMPAPDGDGLSEDLRKFPIAQFALDFPEDLRVDPGTMSTERIHQVFEHAGDESRLDGESLVASAGWCAPSEIMYQLPNNEIVDGILSVPEVQVNRGGFKHTTGIDWATLYAGVGFLQTEAQAISGTTKTCYEVPCPTFVDERLDAIGVCIKVPILLESAYPEMVTNITSRSMVAHQYKVNASVASRIVTAAGAARNFTTDLGSVVADTLSGVNLVLTQLRQKYRIGQNATMEVIFPAFAKEVFREDLSNRNGRATPDAVSDAEIDAHFRARNANVQYIYGWQELTTTDLVWPTNLNFVAYPAGTFVKGTSNVINLSAVYDAASMAVNIYTGLFMEQGLLVAKMNYEAVQATVPTNQSGRMGALNLT